MSNEVPGGLYLVTPDGLCNRPEGLARMEAALSGGARLVQLRDKTGTVDARVTAGRVLLGLCQRYGARLIVNDDFELARDIGADGVHLGKSDAPVARARTRLGPAAIIGVSCYNSLVRAREAQDEGADYVAFGSFYPSPTKPRAVRADPQLLVEAKRVLTLPTAAIGGITPDNGARLVAAGANLLAVIEGVFSAEDPRQAAADLTSLFPHPAGKELFPSADIRS